MGIWEKMPDSFLDKLRDEFGFEPPREHGFDTVNTLRAMRDGAIGVFFALGGNFVSATPDTEPTERAMSSCGLTVHVSTKLNRSHLVHGTEALILPCLGRTERDTQAGGDQFVTVEDSMSMVHASHGRLDPGSPHLRSEVAIVTGLGRALFGDDVGWADMADDYRVIRRHIEHVVAGFENFEARVAEPGGFVLPRGPHDSRTFNTATGKARFTVNPPDAIEAPPATCCCRRFDLTISSTPRSTVSTIATAGSTADVTLSSSIPPTWSSTDCTTVTTSTSSVSGPMASGAQSTFGWSSTKPRRDRPAAYYPETNVLVPLDSTAIGSNTPTSKSLVFDLNSLLLAG